MHKANKPNKTYVKENSGPKPDRSTKLVSKGQTKKTNKSRY